MSADTLRVDWLPEELTAPGRLGVTIAPGRRGLSADRKTLHARDVEVDYAVLADLDVALVVCLQEAHEGAYVMDGRALAARHKINRIALPIVDGGVPRRRGDLRALLRQISAHLDAGESVVVHCAGGLGRSGVVVGCWLRSQGLDESRTEDELFALRGPRCPENGAQRAYIRAWSRYLKRSPS